MMKLNKKGFTMVGLILSFVSLLIYVVLLPALNSMISTAIPSLDPMSAMIIQLFPLILLIMSLFLS